MWCFKTTVLLCVACTLVASQLTRPEECGSDVGCYHDCENDQCSFVVTWKENGDTVDFTLSLALESGASDRWIALGLSGDDSMGDDSVTDCIQNENDVVVQKSHNTVGKKFNEPLQNPTEGITVGNGGISNNVLTCSYTQTIAATNSKIFDLNTDWYMLVANGDAASGTKDRHSLTTLPAISPREVDLQSTDDVTGTAKNVLVKAHGCLMMFAWIFCASIGIVLARYFKPMWPNNELCSNQIWFVLHRVCMITALLACLTAFVLIFAEIQEWSYLEGSSKWQRAHPYLGVIVTALCVINPIMAIFRPHPDGKNRYLFNWAHWGVGTCAHLLAGLTLILGVTLGKASVPFYIVWILVAWILYQIVIELLFEISTCCSNDREKRYRMDGTRKNPRGHMLKTFMLTVHVFVITCFTVACIVILAIN